MIVKAYAKINLILKVNGILENGYHDLKMINSRIDLFDKIIIKKSKEDWFDMKPNLCEKKDNIAYKAYLLIKEKFSINNNYKILIKKRIPSGAGLGGGSADAAAIINSILELENIKIDNDKKIEIAKSIGADVPYCLFGNKCIVEGIGDKITPIDVKNEWSVILASPGLFFSTRKIFEMFDANDSSANFDIKIEDFKQLYKYIFNDLEKPVEKAYPDFKLNEIKKDFEQSGALKSLMTGSGSNVFALFNNNDKKAINCCIRKMKQKYPEIIFRKCKTISY